MNVFRIKVLHSGPKDSHESIQTYLLAENELQVLEWIDKTHRYGAWSDAIKDGDTKWDGDTDKEIPVLQYLLENHGDLEDEEGYDDAYYGVTKMGWELVCDARQLQDIEALKALGIITQP